MADGTQSIYLADMSGDGLTDVVRVQCHDLAHWREQLHLGRSILCRGRLARQCKASTAPAQNPWSSATARSAH